MQMTLSVSERRLLVAAHQGPQTLSQGQQNVRLAELIAGHCLEVQWSTMVDQKIVDVAEACTAAVEEVHLKVSVSPPRLAVCVAVLEH